MKPYRFNKLPFKFSALLLSLALCLPSSVLAMRVEAGLESKTEKTLQQTLTQRAGAEESMARVAQNYDQRIDRLARDLMLPHYLVEELDSALSQAHGYAQGTRTPATRAEAALLLQGIRNSQNIHGNPSYAYNRDTLARLISVLEPTPVGAGAEEVQAASKRLRAVFNELQLSETAVAGIGPAEARRFEKTLMVLVDHMPVRALNRIFVLTDNATQAVNLLEESNKFLLAASNHTISILEALENFRNWLKSERLSVQYLANQQERDSFAANIRYGGWDGQINVDWTPAYAEADLRFFLRQLLANLQGVGYASVKKDLLDRVVADVEILTGA